MSRLSRLLLVGAFFVCTAGFRPVGLADEGQPPTVVTAGRLAALAEAPQPTLGARAAILLDSDSGQILYAHRAGERLAPASTTKLMTALLVVESGRYIEPVTIEPEDLVGGSAMGLASGETLTVRDLLDGLLLVSGNDAAYALARHVGRSLPGSGRPLERFIARMNARADELGLHDTAFRNPEGLDAAGHYSSAADLAALARAALRQPVIAQLVATAGTTVQTSRRAYPLRNTNQLLGTYPGALGVKTGTTDAAGECLIALVERQGQRLLAVILGSGDRYADTASLIDWGFEQHRWLAPSPALAEAAARPGWSVALAPQPAVAVPAHQVQFVAYRLRQPDRLPTRGPMLEVVVLDRLLARYPIVMVPLGRTGRPYPGW
jgi:D-alanyl-D-alanine carboxypeptidase (penicillin-binding protein 5/6)